MKRLFVLPCLLLLSACPVEETCYSPTQNLDLAYEDGAEGCACDEATDEGACEPDSTGREVALLCKADVWVAVQDGPCW